MIEIEKQEWQQMKAKLSQMEQQNIQLKNYNKELEIQNQSLKNQLYLCSFQLNQISQFKAHSPISQNDFPQSPQSFNNRQSNHDVVTINLLDPIKNYQFQNVQEIDEKHQKAISLQQQKPSDMAMYSNLGQIDNKISDHEKLQLQNFQSPRIKQGLKFIQVYRKSHDSHQILQPLLFNHKISELQGLKNNRLHLIEEICVFGPSLSQQNLQQITFKTDQKQLVPPSLYYPHNLSAYENYGSYLFPKYCRVKPTQKSNIAMEANKILFKSSKKPQCKIFIFQGSQNLHPIKEPNQMLQMVNPSKRLYGLVFEFNDFVFQQVIIKQSPLKIGRSIQQADEMYEMETPSVNREKGTELLQLNRQGFLQEQIRMESASLKDIEFENQSTRMYRSRFCLCIFTYFPLVNYLQSIVSAMIDQVKLKRIEHFPQSEEFKDCDIFYMIKQIDNVAQRIRQFFNTQPLTLGKSMTLCVNEIQLHIDMSNEKLQRQLCQNWASKIIKIMDVDTFYSIFCMVMMEQTIMFVCQDQRLLTWIVFLFASILTKPFIYPYPVVSVLFNQQLLQTPFTSILGINQSQQWLHRAIESKTIDAEHKQIIYVSEKQVKIPKTSNFIVPKSQGLRKIIAKLYKKAQLLSLSSILLKKDSFLRKVSLPLTNQPNPKQTNEQVFNFLEQLKIFYDENLFQFLPKSIKIQKKEQYGGLNKVTMRNDILNEIEKQYKKVNRYYKKDEFLKEFIKTQIFSIHLMKEYGLNV